MLRPSGLTITEPLATSLRRGSPLVWIGVADEAGERTARLGWGVRFRAEAQGPHRFAVLAEAFRTYAATNPDAVAFVSVAFADESEAPSVLVVPDILGYWEEGSLRVNATPPEPTPERPLEELDLLPGQLTREGYRRAVADALRRIESGALEKVVLARDLLAAGPDPIDLPGVLVRLTEANPGAMIFHVDGLFGASPELLVHRDGRELTSRVLAGSIRATGDARADADAASALSASAKDAAEHAYAVVSVAERLAAIADVEVSETRVLRLPTIQHLATDITARLNDGHTALDVAGLVHPSAAVCGTPTEDAARMIPELEGFDRGRYAGPVGWLSAGGDGEFAIALRCGLLSPDERSVRLYAGGGIVEGSDPSEELAETAQKFLPVYQALSPVARP